MAKGRCINIPKCPLALSKEIQEADKANFVCKHCGKPLMEVQGPPIITDPGDPWKKYKKLIIIGSAAAVLLGGGGIAAYFMSQDKPAVVEPGGDEGKVVLTNWISIMEGKSLTLKVGENKTLSLDCDPGNATEPVNWSSSNESAATVDGTGTVTAVGAGTATITATTTVKKNTASIEVTVKSPGGSGDPGEPGEIKLPYGTYTGASKNGKPHGVGRLVYSKAMVINSHDPKKRMAQPGESVQGEFVNGEITIGKHFDASGNLIQSLNFGVAP